MKSVFLSYPKPFLKKQERFINGIKTYLKERGFDPRTLGVTDYNMAAPLEGIKRIMNECNGIITVAFRRNRVINGIGKPDSDINEKSYSLDNKWLTSPYCQIEPAMAYQLGLPVLILREKGVYQEGILEIGVLGTYMPEFKLDDNDINKYFLGREWNQLIQQWENEVRNYNNKN